MAAVERREWGKVDRSDSDLSGRVETASGDTGTAVPLDTDSDGSEAMLTQHIGNMVVRLADRS